MELTLVSASSSHVILTSVSETARCTRCRKSARRASSRECFCQTIGCRRIIQLTHVPVSGRLVLPSLAFVWAPCRSTKVFKPQEPFLFRLDDGHGLLCCCRLQSLLAVGGHVLVSRDTSCVISMLHSRPCKRSSRRSNTDLRAQGILFGEIESIAVSPVSHA